MCEIKSPVTTTVCSPVKAARVFFKRQLENTRSTLAQKPEVTIDITQENAVHSAIQKCLHVGTATG
ncbi:hypothetical protein FQN60_003434, partial [Etheostoma spectabile]